MYTDKEKAREAMMSHDNPACQWFERVWNGNDLSAIAALGTADMKAHGADGGVTAAASAISGSL
jgi:hypothetical protein